MYFCITLELYYLIDNDNDIKKDYRNKKRLIYKS